MFEIKFAKLVYIHKKMMSDNDFPQPNSSVSPYVYEIQRFLIEDRHMCMKFNAF